MQNLKTGFVTLLLLLLTGAAHGQTACVVNGQTLRVGDIYEERWSIPPNIWQTIYWKTTAVTDHGDGTCWVTLAWAGDAVMRHEPDAPEYALASIDVGAELEVMFEPDGDNVLVSMPSHSSAAMYINTDNPADQIYVTIDSEAGQWRVAADGTFVGVQYGAFVTQNDLPVNEYIDVEVEGNLITGSDGDGDGIPDVFDNCSQVSNEAQIDSDGDGIGNRCDGDIAQPNDCLVNAADLGALRRPFFTSPGDELWNPDADFNGDNQISVIDLGLLRTLFFALPGPSGIANNCADPTVVEMTIGPGIDDLPAGATCTQSGSGISCILPMGVACTPGKNVKVDAHISAAPNGPNDFVKGRALCGGLVEADTQPATGPAPFATTQSGFQTTRAASCELIAQFVPGVQGSVTCAFD